MAGSTKYEGSGEVYLNGRLMAEASSVGVDESTGDQLVKTMQKKNAGFSDGAGDVSITFDNMVPKAGFDIDLYDLMRRRQEVRFVHVLAGQRSHYAGRITQLSAKQGVTETAAVNGTFTGWYVGGI